MNNTDQLKNNGISIIGEPQRSSEKTIIVLGAARGGTSLCSTVLNELGIFLGKDNRSPVYEDIPLSHALENQDFDTAKELIEEYNQLHKIWGFKRPTINSNISNLHKIVRNPVYIIVFRDVLAIAKRNSICTGETMQSTMSRSLNEYNTILKFIDSDNPSALLVSYEKALVRKNNFVETIINFLSIEKSITDIQIRNAKSSISPSPSDYLKNTNEISYYGYLDSANLSTISGWATINRFEENAQLDLYINKTLSYSFISNEYRDDIKSKKIHSTGNCGFNFSYPNPTSPQSGDTISIKFKDTDIELRGSPITL